VAGILRRLTGRGAPTAPPEPPGTLELRGNGTRVVVVPELGGRITALELGGREWLRAGGTLDECFPTRAACTVGGSAAGGGIELPERGEPSTQRAEVRVETTAEGNIATSAWRGRLMPWLLERRVRVAPSGEVEMRYAATNEGKKKLPYLWTAEALLPLTTSTRLLVTEGTPLRVGDAQGIAIGARGAEHRWPHVRLEKTIADLSRPARVARKYACRLFLAMKDGRLGIEEEGVRLELAFDAAEVPTLGLWLNHRGERIGEERAPDVLGVAPASGAPDSLAEALGEWDGARWLAPGERREWTVTWSAHPTGPAPAR
jgi:galactose mutarotase-like enzyme